MKQLKKRTLALVLASVVTVVGAFGAENYKNSLMGLKFDGSASAVNVTLLTKQNYDKSLNMVRKDTNTYVIMLSETNSEIADSIELGPNISSVDVKTMPYTTSNKGYTKVTVKTSSNIALNAQTSLFLPGSRTSSTVKDSENYEEQLAEEAKLAQKAEIEAQKNQEKSTQQNINADREATKSAQSVSKQSSGTIKSSSGVDQTIPVDIKESVKQFQPSNNTNISYTPAKNNTNEIKNHKTIDEMPAENESKEVNSNILLSLLLGTFLIITMSTFFYVRARKNMEDIIGDNNEFVIDDPKKESKKDDNKKVSKKSDIKIQISKIDKKFSQPVKMPVQKVEAFQTEPDYDEDEQVNIVDLDEILQKEQKEQIIENNIQEEVNSFEEQTEVAEATTEEESEEVNEALEDFLSSFSFDEEDSDNTEAEQDKEELYNKCINNDEIEFSKDDVANINTLMTSEISDEARKGASKFLLSSNMQKVPTTDELLEKFVTLFAVQQNITFTHEDINALYKLISVEIDNDFVTDLKTNPERMKEMQEEIAKQKAKPHKTSELLTLNVKDMLPDLSEALKKQGNKKIEFAVKPQVVYFSEGYEVSTLKLNSELPDLAQELHNESAYVSKPSEEIMYADSSYEVEKMSVENELPNLEDALKNPEKYESEDKNVIKAEDLLNNLNNSVSNVTFKPFDDGARKYEVVNEDAEEYNADNVSDDIHDFAQFFDTEAETNTEETSEVEEANESDEDNSLLNEIAETDGESADEQIQNINREELSEASKLLEQIKDYELKKKDKQNSLKLNDTQENAKDNRDLEFPEYCTLDDERFNIISKTSFDETKGCYLAKNESGYSVIGFADDKLVKIKHYDKLNIEKLNSRISEKLDDGTQRYIIRTGIHKFIINVKDDNMEFVMDLC